MPSTCVHWWWRLPPPPFTGDDLSRYDSEQIAAAVGKSPGAFACLGGGGTLNPMIQEAVRFERLLAHNPRATIVWAHAGSDNTGYRTPDLCRRLLRAHANLYMQVKVDPVNPGKNYPLDAVSGRINPDWLQLFHDFPDRFVIGTDQHYPMPASGAQRWQASVFLLNQLPGDIREKIGARNAQRIYRY